MIDPTMAQDECIMLPVRMTLRDWFAGQALAGLIVRTIYGEPTDEVFRGVAKAAYSYADAMLKARER